MDSKKLYYQITIPACDGDATGMVLCESDSPHSIAAIVIALLEVERKRPSWIRIDPRMDVSCE